MALPPPLLLLPLLLLPLLLLGCAAPAQAGFACLSSPCLYGICMDDLNSSFTCYCIDGYTGALCQTNWDECWSSPCLNGGSCVDGVASFNCTCADGFVGELCEQDVNECFSNPCLNNGTCLDGPNGYACMCVPGYSGDRCEYDVAVCNTSAEARCSNGGACQEGPGVEFSCSCAPGWTGSLCEEPLNECESSPCQHGGVCVDLHADFACACLFGYTGRHCELELEPCARNPCLNDALCLLEDGVDVCYCVPDFHGDRCQLQYDECRLGPGCQNGGTCIDGVDEFSCTCPPGLTGERCECMLMGGYLNCSIATSTPAPAFTTAESSASTSPGRLPPPFSPQTTTTRTTSTSASAITTTTLTSTTTTTTTAATTMSRSSAGTTSTSRVETHPSSETPPDIALPTTAGLSETSTTTLGKSTSSSFSRTPRVRPFPPITSQAPPSMTSAMTTVWGRETTTGSPPSTGTKSDVTTVSEVLVLSTSIVPVSGWSNVTASGSTWSTTTRPWIGEGHGSPVWTDFPRSSPRLPATDTTLASTALVVTGSFSSTLRHTGSTVQAEEDKTTSSGATTPATPEPSTPPEPTEMQGQGVTSTTAVEADVTSSSVPSSTTEPMPTHTDQTSSAVSSEATAPTPTAVTEAPGSQTTSGVSAPPQPGEATTSSTSPSDTAAPASSPPATTSRPGAVSPDSTSAVPMPSPTGAPITSVTDEAPASSTSTFETDMTTTEEGVSSTDFLWTTQKPPLSSTVGTEGDGNATDCNESPCQNGGTCVASPDGSSCVCAFGWGGPRCSEAVQVLTAAFTGHSYLTHGLAGWGALGMGSRVALQARTLAPSGLLLHAALAPELYMTLYMEEGLLKFQFSCGVQTMVFSEVQHRVNNGFDLHISASLEVLPPRGVLRACGAALHLNHTLAMSGEQQSLEHRDPGRMLLYLGGLPRQDHPDYPADPPLQAGFVGCVHHLEIDDKPRRIYQDAVDGAEVSECAALACLSAPCQSGGTCVQRSRGSGWSCLCPSGYVGDTCEISVCRNNPCMFGGTCLPYPASGFLCLCPLGKHGLFCESDLEIAQPSFSPSVAGLSSFAAYSLPVGVEDAVEFRFRFVPTTQDQIGLMLFLGQDGPHDSSSDHLAVSFIKGYVVLTWNLGSGPRRIFTPRPLEPRGRRPHSVRVGRSGTMAWLLADNLANVSGSSPGGLTQLNTQPLLYLGGHDAVNFSGLPHDLPLHSGFAGCLLDVEIIAGAGASRVSVTLERARAAAGRGVGQCGTTLCHARACQHRAACLHHAATFSCLCEDGWFGPVCGQRFNPCDSTRHRCGSGSTCVPLLDGYECDCPLGRSGRYCEDDEPVSDVLLTGRRSFVSLGPVDLQRPQACVGLEVRPLADNGVLLHIGHPLPRSPSLALLMRGGLLEARVAAGLPGRRGVVTVRSRRALAREEWHKVRVCRYGRRLFLWVDGAAHSVGLRPAHRLPAAGAPLNIGGAADLSALPGLPSGSVVVPLHGCVRGVSINWRHTPLDRSHIQDARNVRDCDGTACGGDVCLHGGSCWLGDQGAAYCTCMQGYSGAHCEKQLSCVDLQCHNLGRCVSARCHCPAGWGGPFCEEEMAVGTPHFAGEGYLALPLGSDDEVEGGDRGAQAGIALVRSGEMRRVRRDVSFLYLNFSTTQENGMILWSAEDEDLLGVGVEEGRLKVVWGWQGAGVFVAMVPGPPVSDGAWHDLALSLGANISLWTDQVPDAIQRPSTLQKPVSTGGIFYLGGFPGDTSVVQETRGLFNTQFHGCVQQISWNHDLSVTDFSGFRGENVGSCELFEP